MWCDLGESVGACDIFSFLFDWSAHKERYILPKTAPESDQLVNTYSNWRILKTIEIERNTFLFLAVSHNQCSWLPIDSAISQHICQWVHGWIELKNCSISRISLYNYNRMHILKITHGLWFYLLISISMHN